MNILVIDAWLPTPDRDSASLRMVNLLAVLQELLGAGAVSFAPDDFYARASGLGALCQSGIHVLAPPTVSSIIEHLGHSGERYEVILLSRVAQASKYLALVRELCPRACVIFDTTDLHYLRAFRGARVTRNSNLMRRALETQRVELAAVRQADATLVVSPVEQEILKLECPDARVYVVSNIHPDQASKHSFDERDGIVFVGAFPHHPNQDAMRYFFDEIYPLFKAQLPSVPLTIIGSQPPDWLGELASANVVVTGHVDDLARYLDRCRLTIAPLRYGAGVKGKVLTSMSYGVPVVASSIAAEGIPARDRRDLLIADDAPGFCDAMRELYTNQTLWNTLSTNGLELVRQHFSAAVARAALVEVLRNCK